MVWYRPTKAELDKLESLGNLGWNWENLLPVSVQLMPNGQSDFTVLTAKQYIEAAERNIPPNDAQRAQGAGNDPDVHGHHGFINTSFPVCFS